MINLQDGCESWRGRAPRAHPPHVEDRATRLLRLLRAQKMRVPRAARARVGFAPERSFSMLFFLLGSPAQGFPAGTCRNNGTASAQAVAVPVLVISQARANDTPFQ